MPSKPLFVFDANAIISAVLLPGFALAHGAQAACIVAGDKDLLVLNPYRGVSILMPKQFLDAPPDA